MSEEIEVRKPKSVLSLVGIANYLLSSGEIASPKTSDYEAYVKSLNGSGDILVCIILEDGTFVGGGEVPESLKDVKVKHTLHYQLPVKYNIHINQLAKSVYKFSSMDPARAYKISLTEFFSITEGDFDSVIDKSKEKFGAAEFPLPCVKGDVEEDIKTFYRYPVGSEALAAATTRKAPKNADGTAKKGKTATANENLLKAVVLAESNRSRIKYNKVDKMELTGTLMETFETPMLETDPNRLYKFINTFEFRKVEDIGGPFFPQTYRNGNDVSIDLAFRASPIENIGRVYVKADISKSTMENIMDIILHSEFAGETVHETKLKTFIFDKKTYNVYIRGDM